jgi:hypothetical protein
LVEWAADFNKSLQTYSLPPQYRDQQEQEDARNVVSIRPEEQERGYSTTVGEKIGDPNR